MPKMKTHRGAAKRFKATGKGRLKQSRQNSSYNKLTTTSPEGLIAVDRQIFSQI
jgi:ribosomal protein L35